MKTVQRAIVLITMLSLWVDNINTQQPLMQAQNPYWASSNLNIQQPVSNPGFTNYNGYSPAFMNPVPPQMMVSNLVSPSRVYYPSQRKMKKQIKIVSYPQQMSTPFNGFANSGVYNSLNGAQGFVNNNQALNYNYPMNNQPNYGQFQNNQMIGMQGFAPQPSSNNGFGLNNQNVYQNQVPMNQVFNNGQNFANANGGNSFSSNNGFSGANSQQPPSSEGPRLLINVKDMNKLQSKKGKPIQAVIDVPVPIQQVQYNNYGLI